jgi:tyrosine-protein kinase Etk/Wzc
MEPNYNEAEGDLFSINYTKYFYKILKDWWIALLLIILCTVVSIAYIRYKSPMYRINAKLLVQNDQKFRKDNAGELINLNELVSNNTSVDNEIEILKTRSLVEYVVNHNNLFVQYYKKGKVNNVEIYPSPFLISSKLMVKEFPANSFDFIPAEDGKHFTIKALIKDKMSSKNYAYGDEIQIGGIGTFEIHRDLDVPFRKIDYMFVFNNPDHIIDGIKNNLDVKIPSKLTTAIDISLQFNNKAKGEYVLGKIIETYIEKNSAYKTTNIDSAIAFIDNRLNNVRNELGVIEGDIQDFKQKNNISDISEQSKQLIRNSAEGVNKIADLETKISVMNSIESLLQDSRQNKVIPANIVSDDPIFSKLIDNYNTLLLEKEKMSLTSTDDNPYIKNLDDRLSTVKRGMLSNLQGNKKNITIARDELRRNLNNSEKDVKDIPEQERTVLDYSRQQQIKQDLYLYLLKKKEEVAISKTANVDVAKVIDTPKSELKPSSPKKLLVLALGVIAGLFLYILRIFILELTNKKVRSKTDIANNTQIEILAELGRNISKNPIVFDGTGNSKVAEQVRWLRTAILDSQYGKTILVTSCSANEGKSFCANNLAVALAEANKKVVLVDLDFRNPSTAKTFDIKTNQGVSDFVKNVSLKVEDVICKIEGRKDLFVVPNGQFVSNPSELLTEPKIKTLMDYLEANFDYIILDTHYVKDEVDTHQLLDFAQRVVLVVKHRSTKIAGIKYFEQTFKNTALKKVGILVNDISSTKEYLDGANNKF